MSGCDPCILVDPPRVSSSSRASQMSDDRLKHTLLIRQTNARGQVWLLCIRPGCLLETFVGQYYPKIKAQYGLCSWVRVSNIVARIKLY